MDFFEYISISTKRLVLLQEATVSFPEPSIGKQSYLVNNQEILVELNFKKTGLAYRKQLDDDRDHMLYHVVHSCLVLSVNGKWEGGGEVMSVKYEKYEITKH